MSPSHNVKLKEEIKNYYMSWCWWCCHSFEGEPLTMPCRYDDRRSKFYTAGNYSSWSCIKYHAIQFNPPPATQPSATPRQRPTTHECFPTLDGCFPTTHECFPTLDGCFHTLDGVSTHSMGVSIHSMVFPYTRWCFHTLDGCFPHSMGVSHTRWVFTEAYENTRYAVVRGFG